MPWNRILHSLKLCILFAALFPLTGCLTEGTFEAEGPLGDSGSRGSLSQAMKSSASGSTQPVPGSGYSENSAPVMANVNVAVATGSGGGVTKHADEGRDYTAQVPVDVAYSVPFNGEFQSITRFTITPLCLENDRYSVGLFLSGDIVGLKPGTLPDNAIENAWMLEAGVAGRLYLNPAHAFISPYFSANIAYQVLFWDYRNPVYTSDGDTIQSDALQGMGGYVGFGVAFYRSSHLNLFGEAGVGGTAFTDQTAQGFDNDVFHNFGYFSVKAGLCVKF